MSIFSFQNFMTKPLETVFGPPSERLSHHRPARIVAGLSEDMTSSTDPIIPCCIALVIHWSSASGKYLHRYRSHFNTFGISESAFLQLDVLDHAPSRIRPLFRVDSVGYKPESKKRFRRNSRNREKTRGVKQDP